MFENEEKPRRAILVAADCGEYPQYLGEFAGLDTAGRIMFIPEMFAVFAQSRNSQNLFENILKNS